MKNDDYQLLAQSLAKSSETYSRLLLECKQLEAISRKLARKLRDEDVRRIVFRTFYDSRCPCYDDIDDTVLNSVLEGATAS